MKSPPLSPATPSQDFSLCICTDKVQESGPSDLGAVCLTTRPPRMNNFSCLLRNITNLVAIVETVTQRCMS